MNKLVSRSLEIINEATSKVFRDYTSNLTSLVEDAKTVRNSLMKTGTDASDTFAKLKNTNITKKISDWFYNEESSGDSSSDEFDAGFKIDSSDDSAKLDGDEKTRELTADSMSDITEKQTNTMVKIGRRQTEQSVANTAEIISAFNTRSSEMISVMNSINKSLNDANDRLEKLVKASEMIISINGGGSKEESKGEVDKGSLFSDGKLTLSGILEASKRNVSNNALVGTAMMGINALKEGALTPESLVADLLKNTVLKKDFQILGGKSINELGKKFNEFIGEAAQTAMTELIGSKPFKSIFGDITQFDGDTDYGRLVPNHYDTKRAQFDGMTRMSIIKVIPDLLIELNKSVSGKSFHIDKTGSLVEGPVANKFASVTDNLTASSGLTSNASSKIGNSMRKTSSANKFAEADIDLAGRILAGVIGFDLHSKGTRVFRRSDLKNTEAMSGYIKTATTILCSYKDDAQYWATLCQTIVLQVSEGISDSSKFISNINQQVQNTIQQATEFAQSDTVYSKQATRISLDMMANRFYDQNIKSLKNDVQSQDNNNDDDDKSKKKKKSHDGDIRPDYEGNKKSIGKYSIGDYVRGIFGILNRGINVKTTNKSKNTKGYGNYDLERITTDQIKEDEAFAGLMMGAMTGKESAKDLVSKGIKEAMTAALGEQGASAAEQAANAGGGMSGFFGSMAGILGVSGLRSLGTRAFNGTLMNDMKSFVGKTKNSITNQVGKIKNKVTENIPGELLYDQRFRNMKDAVVGENSITSNIKGRASNVMDNVKGRFESNDRFMNVKDRAYGAVNNRLYRADSNKMKRTIERIDNMDINDAHDKMAIEIVQKAAKAGNYRTAKTAVKQIHDKKLRQVLTKDINTLESIDKKRKAGQTALASGKTPDIGSALQTTTSDRLKDATTKNSVGSKILNVVKKGFSAVGKVLGKIAKFTAKLATDGLMNIAFGFKTMASGLFGSKQRDADGKVIRDENGKAVRSSGLIKGLTTDLWKTVGNKIGDMAIYKKGGTTVREGLASLKEKTFTGQWERDENGNIVRDENGKRKMTNTATIGDLIKKPGEVLAKSLRNIATDISKSGVGKAVKWLGGKIKSFGSSLAGGIKDVFGNLMEKINKNGFLDNMKEKTGGGIKGLANKGADWFKNTQFGSGVLSGFNEAKAAKAKMNEAKERASSFINRATGDIMDVLKGTGNQPSALTQLSDLIQGIRDDMNNNHQEDIELQEGGGDTGESSSDETPSTPESGQADPTTGGTSASETISSVNNPSSGNVGDGGTPTSDIGSASGGNSGSSGSSDSSGGKKKGGLVGELLNGLGKMMGGFTQALMGIFQLVLSIVMSLSGFQALIDLVKSILTDGLQPLNAVFESVIDLVKPIVSILKTTVSTIAETVVSIASSIISVIQPLMEFLTPIIEDIMEFIEPILDSLKILVSAIMVPLLIIIKALQPVIEGIGYTLQIMSGILQTGMGIVITMLGGIMAGIGKVVDVFGGGSEILDQGKAMVSQGAGMMKSGGEQVISGIKGLGDLASRLIPGGEPLIKETNTDTENKDTQVNTDNVNINGGAMGSGDVNTTNNSYIYKYTYGSGNTTMNQHTYGNYMNMSERGCGPVALADAYSRRTGMSVNPASLASRMAGSGAYQPNRGTSVDSFVRTGNAMGMSMRVGGVTQASLKRATPNNPITLLGSGTDYGTRQGNNHYVNVIGTDHNGGAYVSNPLTGRVERRSASTLALNSTLGLYGSGDSDTNSFYALDETTSSALENLKNLTSKLTGMFTGDSEASKVQKAIDEGEEADKAKNIKRQLDDEQLAAVEQEAYDAFLNDNPKLDGETDDEYNARMEKLWSKQAVYNKYIVKYGGQKAVDASNALYNKLNEELGSASNAMNDFSEGVGKISSGSAVGGPGVLSSVSGAQMYNFGEPQHKYTNITSGRSGESPVHDFFGVMGGSEAFSDSDWGHWFQYGRNPDSKGVGKSGRSHGGIDINWVDGSEGKELHAITGGKVTRADFSESAGYNVQWEDSGGYHHWYMHMLSQPLVKAGDTIEAGQLLGYVGNTGYSEGAHLHYTVKKNPYGSSGDADVINPLTYFSEYTPVNTLVGNDTTELTWNCLVTHGLTKEGAAAVMGNMEAESGIRPNNLQDMYEPIIGLNDEQYTSAVDTGSYNNFENDEAGYGLCQWTVSDRKGPLYDYVKSSNSSIADLAAQLNFLVLDEFPRLFSSIYDELQTTHDISSATERFMRKFENPRDQSSTAIQGRIRNAQSFYDKYKDLNPTTQVTPTGQGSATTGFGQANSAWDANIIHNVQNINTQNGINSGTVNTSGGVLYFRSGPGTDNDIIGQFENGYKFDKLEYDGHPNWYKTTYDGKTGYVSADYILLDQSYTGNTIIDPDSQLDYIDTNKKPVVPNSAWDVKLLNGNNPSGNNNNSSIDNSTVTSYFDNHVRFRNGMPYLYINSRTPTGYPILAFDKADGEYIMTHGSTNSDDIKSFYLYKRMNSGDYQLNQRETMGMSDLDAFNLWEEKTGRTRSKKFNGYYYSYGSGDTDPWYDSLLQNNNQIISDDIPDLDPSKFTNYDTNTQPIQNFISKYEIKTDDTKRDGFLDKMSKMTFNVRAQRVEELLEELIEKVSGEKSSKKNSTSYSATDPNLFKSNSIPNQIVRLSRG